MCVSIQLMTCFGLPATILVHESNVFVWGVIRNPGATLCKYPCLGRMCGSCVFTHVSGLHVRFVCSPLLWSTLMCDTDQQCQSPAAVMPVPPKARKTPHISHITSLKSFILLSVLRDLTQWLFMPRDPARACSPVHSCAFKVRSNQATITR